MTPTRPLVIVADDLSGAADTAVAFLSEGCQPVVRWGASGGWSGAPAWPAVLAIDTESRRGTAESASRATSAAVEAARHSGAATLFKKIDSTLRGHVGSEVAAAVNAWDSRALAVVAPAFPEVGRTTIHGCQFVNGTPVSAPALVPRFEAAGLQTGVLELECVRADGLAARMAEQSRVGCRAVVCDAETIEDLSTIARATLAIGHRAVWVGSGGLARALATEGVVSGALEPRSARWAQAPTIEGPVLVVVGSATAVARRQAQFVAQCGAVPCAIPLAALRNPTSRTGASDAWAAARGLLREGRDVVLTVEAGGEAGDDHRIVMALAAGLRSMAGLVGGVVVTGGETAVHLFEAWGISGLTLMGEVEPGVPSATTLGCVTLRVVTKAGGFGDPATLERARRYLHGDSEPIQSTGSEAV